MPLTTPLPPCLWCLYSPSGWICAQCASTKTHSTWQAMTFSLLLAPDRQLQESTASLFSPPLYNLEVQLNSADRSGPKDNNITMKDVKQSTIFFYLMQTSWGAVTIFWPCIGSRQCTSQWHYREFPGGLMVQWAGFSDSITVLHRRRDDPGPWVSDLSTHSSLNVS